MIAYISWKIMNIEPKLFPLQTIWENGLDEEFYLIGYIAV
jgi:hypothetical protein